MYQSLSLTLSFFADIDEKPDFTAVWLLPVLFILLGAGCWFYAYTTRKAKGDSIWRWIIAYIPLGGAVWVAGNHLWDLVMNPFVQALVDGRRLRFSYYFVFILTLVAFVGFLYAQFNSHRFKKDELSY